MKIICIEEHTVDAAMAQAGRETQAREGGYMADWGSRVTDRPEDYRDDRPHLQSFRAATDLARDLGPARIQEMDKHGIDVQFLSYSTSPQFVPAGDVVDLTRAANDRLAETVTKHPTRFGGFACLPWQHPQSAADELERCVKDLGLKGVLLAGRPGDTFLDDPRYEPVLAKLSELKVPVYVHPGLPVRQVRDVYYGGFEKEISARLSVFGWGWHNEAGIQVIRMILAGLCDRYPELQIISGHWGEMVPFYLQRMDDMMSREVTGLMRSITDTYRKHVYVTPSGMLNTPHFEFIHKVLGADRIIYSMDYPYLTNDGARAFLENLSIGQEDREKIAHGNAERLFRL